MFGSDPFGSVPFAADEAEEPFDYDAMLSEDVGDAGPLVYTLMLYAWHIDNDEEQIQYYASSEWGTGQDDYPASRSFDGVLDKPLDFRRSTVSDRLGINYTSPGGRIVLNNADGHLDDLDETYAIDGRRAVVRVGRKSSPFIYHKIIFDGIALDLIGESDEVAIVIRDNGYRLDVPLQPNIYLGTGGAEGGSDLTGKRKPLVLGRALGVPPVLIDSATLTYQVHDGSIVDLEDVYDRGVELTPETDAASYAELIAGTVAAGKYDYANPTGMFRLGSNPSGFLFATVDEYDLPESTVTRTVRVIAERAAGLADGDLDEDSFNATFAETSFLPVGVYYGIENTLTAKAAIDAMMASVGGWAGYDRLGKLQVGVLLEPSGDPVARFDREEGDIFSLEREKLPEGVWPPPWRWRLSYGTVYVTSDDFAATVPVATVDYYSTPFRIHVDEDSSILDDHPQAKDKEVLETYFYSEASASYEAGRLSTLYSSGYRLYRIDLSRRALLLELGDLIFVTYPRYGLEAGRLMRVVEINDTIDLSDGSQPETIEVLAFG